MPEPSETGGSGMGIGATDETRTRKGSRPPEPQSGAFTASATAAIRGGRPGSAARPQSPRPSRPLVGLAGFEPTAPCPPGTCSTRLSYSPTKGPANAKLPSSRCQRTAGRPAPPEGGKQKSSTKKRNPRSILGPAGVPLFSGSEVYAECLDPLRQGATCRSTSGIRKMVQRQWQQGSAGGDSARGVGGEADPCEAVGDNGEHGCCVLVWRRWLPPRMERPRTME